MTFKKNTIPPKRLSETISASATGFKLNDILGFDGVALTSAIVGEVLYGSFQDPSGTILELFKVDPTTIASTTISFLKRGLQFNEDGTETEVAGNKLLWINNQTIVNLGTDAPALYNAFIDKFSAETIAGIKTFSVSPIVPIPTTNTQAANKVYTDTKVSLTGDETVAGIKTFSSSPIVPAPTTNFQTATKKYVDDTAIAGAPNASTTVKGIVKLDTAPASATEPIAVGTNRVVSTSSGAADSTKIPSLNAQGNLSNFVVPDILDIAAYGSTAKTFYSDTAGTIVMGTSVSLDLVQSDYVLQKRTFTSDWASAAESLGLVRLGAYIYAFYRDASNNYRVYRYERTNLASGGTLMTISGQAFATTGGATVKMTSNGTDFFFTHKGGNSANDYVVSKYTLSGTTLTYSSDITCGSTAGTLTGIAVDSSVNIYGLYNADNTIRKFNSSGTLQYTTPAFGTANVLANVAGLFYGYVTTPVRFVKIILT